MLWTVGRSVSSRVHCRIGNALEKFIQLQSAVIGVDTSLRQLEWAEVRNAASRMDD